MKTEPTTSTYSVGQLVTLACLAEVAAPKPGNVHPAVSFADLTCADFIASARAIGPVFETATAGARLGRIVVGAVDAMLAACGTNTHLGTILLLAPLAMVRDEESFPDGVRRVLADLDAVDAADVYAAIRAARPGGLGVSQQHDVAGSAPSCLVTAMRLAADRDRVAAQYADGFDDVLTGIVPRLGQGMDRGWSASDTIVHTHVWQMCRHPDSLIARKCGLATARRSAELAGEVLAAGDPGTQPYVTAIRELDSWLRADGHRRNPGTTADLVTAGLFVALRSGAVDIGAAEEMTAALTDQ